MPSTSSTARAQAKTIQIYTNVAEGLQLDERFPAETSREDRDRFIFELYKVGRVAFGVLTGSTVGDLGFEFAYQLSMKLGTEIILDWYVAESAKQFDRFLEQATQGNVGGDTAEVVRQVAYAEDAMHGESESTKAMSKSAFADASVLRGITGILGVHGATKKFPALALLEAPAYGAFLSIASSNARTLIMEVYAWGPDTFRIANGHARGGGGGGAWPTP